MFKNRFKTILFSLVVFSLVGFVTVSAMTWPTLPSGSTEGGWLGTIFNLNTSGTGTLQVNSKKITLSGSTVADITANADVATKEYVDSRVVASGGSSISTGLFVPTATGTKFYYGCGTYRCCGYQQITEPGVISYGVNALGETCMKDNSKKCLILSGNATTNPENAICSTGCSTGQFASDGTCDGDKDGAIDVTAGGSDINDSNASVGTNLLNGTHSVTQCTVAGGTIFNRGDGQFLCKLAPVANACPSGWTYDTNGTYGYWRQYKSKFCDGRVTVTDTCSGSPMTFGEYPSTMTIYPHSFASQAYGDDSPDNNFLYWSFKDVGYVEESSATQVGDSGCNSCPITYGVNYNTITGDSTPVRLYKKDSCISVGGWYPHIEVKGKAVKGSVASCQLDQYEYLGCY